MSKNLSIPQIAARKARFDKHLARKSTRKAVRSCIKGRSFPDYVEPVEVVEEPEVVEPVEEATPESGE